MMELRELPKDRKHQINDVKISKNDTIIYKTENFDSNSEYCVNDDDNEDPR